MYNMTIRLELISTTEPQPWIEHDRVVKAFAEAPDINAVDDALSLSDDFDGYMVEDDLSTSYLFDTKKGKTRYESFLKALKDADADYIKNKSLLDLVPKTPPKGFEDAEIYVNLDTE